MSIIVVVDDQATNRRVLAKLAASVDGSVVVKAFADPADALSWVGVNTPDLVVTDFKMPVMDGAEFIRRFREEPNCADVPVIVVTAYEDRTFRYSALEAGATDFLLSPVDHTEFAARFRNLLTLRRQQRLIKERAFLLERRIARESDRHERALHDTHESLLRVMDAVPAIICATGPDRRFRFVSAYMADLLGVNPDDAVGKTPTELVDNDYTRNVMALDADIFEMGEVPPRFEERIRLPSGVARTLLTNKSIVRDGRGKVTKVVTVSLDITDRKRAEAAAIEAKEAAEFANRSKTEFLANMSHELRTPLNAIIGFAQVITGQVLGPLGNEKYTEYARNIEDSGRLLFSIIEDILDVSMIEAGRIVLREEPVDLISVLGDVERLLLERAGQAGVDLVCDVTGCEVVVTADAGKVKQVLLNLLSNAVKFTPAGGRISVRIVEDSGGGIVVEIADTGIGMSDREVEIARTRFGRVENPAAASRGGTGLGLPLAISLTELHGGELKITSVKGRGTTVTIRLPPSRVKTCRLPRHPHIQDESDANAR